MNDRDSTPTEPQSHRDEQAFEISAPVQFAPPPDVGNVEITDEIKLAVAGAMGIPYYLIHPEVLVLFIRALLKTAEDLEQSIKNDAGLMQVLHGDESEGTS